LGVATRLELALRVAEWRTAEKTRAETESARAAHAQTDAHSKLLFGVVNE